jgi:hypothetical protein
MFYKALGYLVWKGARFYVGRKLPSLPSRKLVVAGALAVGVATFVAAGAKRDAAE